MENKTLNDAAAVKKGGNADKTGHMCGYSANKKFIKQNIEITEVLSLISRPQREKLVSGYDVKSFAKIFEDEDMMRTVDAFLECGMNVSATARKLYMHRNTLMYRLKAIRKQTGIDLKNFKMALTFKILHTLYVMK